jgi:hypothetical protein
MTRPKIFVTLLLGLFSCGQNHNDKNLKPDTVTKITATKEVWTIYSKQDTIFHTKRLLSTDTGLTLLSYDINTSKSEASEQLFFSKTLSNEQEAATIKSKNTNFNWTPFKTTLTLFVQISGSAFKYDLEPWDKRSSILDSIESGLKFQGHAKWTGCDIGPGGLNMLFECDKIDCAIPVILGVLKQYGYDQKTTIGRRINIDAEDWFYEVIYPASFNGMFLTM